MKALALFLVLLLLPGAAAQFVARPVPGGMIVEPGFEQTLHADIRIESPQKDIAPVLSPWLVAGHDTLLNLTVRNNRPEAVNVTFRFNVSGATVTPDEVTFSIEPHNAVGQTFAIHPEDVGMVELVADAIDAFQPSGEPVRAVFNAPALLLPAMRFLDPPAVPVASEDDEFVQIDQYRGPRQGYTAYLRLRPGESVVPRIELTNPFETSLAGFQLQLQLHGGALDTTEVQPMEPGATQVVEFEEWTPVEQSPFGRGPYYGGPMGSFELRPIATVDVGGAGLQASGVDYRIERGAIVDVKPAWAVVDVQDGLAIDLLVPRKPVLGVPTRVGFNLTNLGTTPAQGSLTVQVQTPNGLFYEVQGPESHQVPVMLGPGERTSGSIELTPRVTGHWQVSTVFRSGQGYGWGGGGGFEVKGPLVIGFDRNEQVFARIGEPVEIGITLAASQTLQDAQLRVTSGAGYYFDPSRSTGANYRPGFADTLIESRSPTSTLGTLRPGGAVNASVEVTGRSSGYYNIVPYVVAEGFAYTSTPDNSPGGPVMPFTGEMMYSTMLSIVVQARPVPAGLSLAPLTIGLAFFVGAWTLRTKFVK